MGSGKDEQLGSEASDAHQLATHLWSGEGQDYVRGISDPELGYAIDVEPRPSREEVSLRIAEVIASRGTCTRARVGAVITQDGRPISAGYAGAPSGLAHCIDVGCDIGNHNGCTRTVHAEANAISFAARAGASTQGADIYTTLAPCYDCAKLIVNSGIRRVFYRNAYRDPRGLNLLDTAGVETYALEPTG